MYHEKHINTDTLDEQVREKIKNCFKRTHMQTEGDTELFDTEITIDELLALFTEHSKQAFLLGYEAGESIANGIAKTMTWEEAKAQLKRNKGEDNE